MRRDLINRTKRLKQQGWRHRYGHYGHGHSTFGVLWPSVALAILLLHQLFTQASVFDETVFMLG